MLSDICGQCSISGGIDPWPDWPFTVGLLSGKLEAARPDALRSTSARIYLSHGGQLSNCIFSHKIYTESVTENKKNIQFPRSHE